MVSPRSDCASLVGSALLLALGCACGAPKAQPVEPAVAVRSATPVTASSIARTPALPSEEERLRGAGTTRGRIACGGSSCEASKERCVSTGGWHCVGASDPALAEDVYACDDASDCESGQACCQSFTSAASSYACSPRSGAGSDCRQEICAEPDGVACPQGQVCRDRVCQPASQRASCEGGKICAQAQPICIWSAGTARCASLEQARSAPHDPERAVLACSKPSDCGPGKRCCTNALWNATQCLTNCDRANNGQLCESDGDCSELASAEGTPRCLRASGDEDPRALPPWIRWCQLPP